MVQSTDIAGKTLLEFCSVYFLLFLSLMLCKLPIIEQNSKAGQICKACLSHCFLISYLCYCYFSRLGCFFFFAYFSMVKKTKKERKKEKVRVNFGRQCRSSNILWLLCGIVFAPSPLLYCGMAFSRAQNIAPFRWITVARTCMVNVVDILTIWFYLCFAKLLESHPLYLHLIWW